MQKVLCAIYIDGLVQERRNSIANALELRLSCTNRAISESYLACLIPHGVYFLETKFQHVWLIGITYEWLFQKWQPANLTWQINLHTLIPSVY